MCAPQNPGFNQGKWIAVGDEEGYVTILDGTSALPSAFFPSVPGETKTSAQWLAHHNAIFDLAWCQVQSVRATANMHIDCNTHLKECGLSPCQCLACGGFSSECNLLFAHVQHFSGANWNALSHSIRMIKKPDFECIPNGIDYVHSFLLLDNLRGHVIREAAPGNSCGRKGVSDGVRGTTVSDDRMMRGC
jgi:hypothetical protein